MFKLSDLFFIARIQEIAKSRNSRFVEVGDYDSLQSLVRNAEGKTVIVFDLMKVQDEIGLLSSLESGSTTLIGFYPHVEKEVGSRARTLGITNTVPRSALELKLRSALSGT